MAKTTPDSDRTHYSRRGFLSIGASSVAAASLAGCAPSEGEVSRQTAARPVLSRPKDVQDAAWADVRAHFILEPGTAYMNNASLGMPPASVAEAVAEGYHALSREPLHGKHDLGEVIANRVMPGLAALSGADVEELSLTRNATEALHLGVVGIASARPGIEVLVTSQEHPAGRRPWEYAASRFGVKVKTVFIPSPFESEDQVVGLIEEALTPNTGAIAFCHVTRGGHRYPVKKLAAMARDRGILCHVDGAQALGMFPVDLHDLGCDTYSVSLHKWLLGPIGTGLFYVRADARDRIASAYAHDATPAAPAFAPPGTVDLPVRAGLAAALDQIEAIGPDMVEARTRYLSDYFKSRLREMEDVTILSGPTRDTSAPGSTIFEMEGVDAVESVGLMEERVRIHIDEHQRDGHNAIRVSTHIYNTTGEIDRLVEGLKTMRA